MGTVREFTTEWGEPFLRSWRQRDEASLLGVVKQGARGAPKFRPFDMLSEPNQALVLLENADMRIGVESVVGTQPHFRRGCDYDELWFQFCGRTTVETECGIFDVGPGELLLIPAGVAHRSTGRADSLRLFAVLRDPLTPVLGESDYASHTEFEMVRAGGPRWSDPSGTSALSKGKVLERLSTWDDAPTMVTLLERDYDSLVNVSLGSAVGEERGVVKLRAFDFFTEIVGKRGGGPKLFESATSHVEVYNIEGKQFGWHRPLRSEEFGLQFRGEATNMSELGAEEIEPGDLYWVPLGIAHTVDGRSGFLRIVIYTKNPWRLVVDPTRHYATSRFEARERVLQAAAWKQ